MDGADGVAIAEDQAAPWLVTTEEAPPDGSDLGPILKAYREIHGLTQAELAERLHLTQPYLSKIETGSRPVHDLDQLRWIADALDLPYERLGLLPDRSADGQPPSDLTTALGVVGDSQRGWCRIRRQLNQHRHVLGRLAASVYPDSLQAAGALSGPGWIPPAPVDLSAIGLSWQAPASTPRLHGGVDDLSDISVLPLVTSRTRYDRYSRAMRDLARPRLFDNRVCYRPTDINMEADRGRFSFGYTSYFEAIDVAEALAHEVAAAWLADPNRKLHLADLPLRAAVGDPLDPAGRPMAMSVNTLTIRQAPGGSASFLLHKRSPAAVAAAGGVYHVIPCGVFQPSSVAPWDQANDFDLWRNIMREFSEELLGVQEHDGNNGQPLDYTTTEPFSSLNLARDQGRVRAYCLGVALEPLTLWVEVQTAVVFEADVFDDILRGLVSHNDEGHLLTVGPGRVAEGIPFTHDSLQRLASAPMAPAAANLLRMAWHHRSQLLG